MCFGGRGGSSSLKHGLTSSVERGGTRSSNQSILSSNPQSGYNTKTGVISSPSVRSTTGNSNRTGGFSSYSNRKNPPRGSTNIKEEYAPLPEETTARSPTRKGSTEEGKGAGISKGRGNKSNARDKVDISSKFSDEDLPTLRNLKESKAEATNGADVTEVNNSEWSIMGKTTIERKKKNAAQKEAARQALKQPSRPSPITTTPPPPPSIPSLPPPPPITSIPTIPSPTTLTPTIPSQVNQSNEKTAMTTLTVKTQHTLIDEENQNMLSTHGKASKKEDLSVDIETRNHAVKIGDGKSTTIQL